MFVSVVNSSVRVCVLGYLTSTRRIQAAVVVPFYPLKSFNSFFRIIVETKVDEITKKSVHFDFFFFFTCAKLVGELNFFSLCCQYAATVSAHLLADVESLPHPVPECLSVSVATHLVSHHNRVFRFFSAHHFACLNC